MHAERLLEASLGRTGLQLHDGLAALGGLPAANRQAPAPRIETTDKGWLLRWPGRPREGRLGIAVRALDAHGQPIRSDGPFVDQRGCHLWCRALDDLIVLVPRVGLSVPATHLDIRVLQLGRGPLRAVGSVRVPLDNEPPPSWSAARWVEPVLILAVAVAHADGVVRDGERDALAALADRLGVLEEIDLDRLLARPTPASFAAAVTGVRQRLPGLGTRTLMERLAAIAVSNGAPGECERLILVEIGIDLGVPEAAVRRLLRGWDHPTDHQGELANALELLALEPGASQEAIKQAWRQRVLQHHPDRVRGSDPEEIERATRETQRLNDAYRLLVEVRTTGVPAPSRQAPRQRVRTAKVRRPRARGLTATQVGIGFFALALLALAVGLAWNGHVDDLLAALEGSSVMSGKFHR